MNVNVALIRRRFALGTTAALMSAAMILSACGGGEPEPVVSTPAAEAPAEEAPAETAATPEVAETEGVTETEEAAAGEEMTETEGMTETEEAGAGEGMTETEEAAAGEEMTETEGMTETEAMTETEEAAAGEEITGTEDVTGSEEMTETEGVEAGEEMTGTEETSEAGTAETAPLAGIVGAEDAQVYATTLLDYDFENADGEVSGEIEDLYIDLSSGQVLFVQIEYGGVLEIGDTELAMPLNAFMIGQEGELVLNFDEAALEAYPDMGDDWPNLEDPAWDDDLNTFWSDLGITTYGDFTEATTSVVAASEFIGYPTADIGGGDGTIEDIIIDLGTGKATYAVVAYDAAGAEVVDEGSFVVPFTAFNLDERGEVLTFGPEVTADVFNTAPRLDRTVYAPGEPLDPTWRDEFDAFWSDLGFDVNGDND